MSFSISIHAPRVGGDPAMVSIRRMLLPFQSTPPVWGATASATRERCRGKHFNPRPPCGGRRAFSAF